MTDLGQEHLLWEWLSFICGDHWVGPAACFWFLERCRKQQVCTAKRALLAVGDHVSLPQCHCCPQGTLLWAGSQEEVLFSGCGCAVGRWGHITDVCTAAQGRIMMLPFIGTHDFCKSYKQTLFCQTVVTMLKTAETKFIFIWLIELWSGHLKSKKISTRTVAGCQEYDQKEQQKEAGFCEPNILPLNIEL